MRDHWEPSMLKKLREQCSLSTKSYAFTKELVDSLDKVKMSGSDIAPIAWIEQDAR
jgi:hypothetical protein